MEDAVQEFVRSFEKHIYRLNDVVDQLRTISRTLPKEYSSLSGLIKELTNAAEAASDGMINSNLAILSFVPTPQPQKEESENKSTDAALDTAIEDIELARAEEFLANSVKLNGEASEQPQA